MRLLKLFSGTHAHTHTARRALLADTKASEEGHYCDAHHESAYWLETSSTHRSKPWPARESESDRAVAPRGHPNCDHLHIAASLSPFQVHSYHSLSSGRGTHVVA